MGGVVSDQVEVPPFLNSLFLTEKQIHAILTHRNKMCVLKVKDLPQILPYNELLLTTGFILSTWIEEGAGR